jgi:accessory gene regulator protein AgrB
MNAIISFVMYSFSPNDLLMQKISKRRKESFYERKRKKYKVISTILGIAYVILITILNNNIISNYLLIGMLESVIMIHPLIYKIFNLPFDNYKKYKLNTV